MAPMPVCTSEQMRTIAIPPEPSINVLLVDTSTALLAGTLAQIEKQLKLIIFSSQTSNSNHEIIYIGCKANL
jgi:hypothetical protein